MRLVKTSSLVVLLIPCLLAISAPQASAQTAGVLPNDRTDGWVSAIGGASFGIDVSSARASLGGEYGEDLTPHVQAYVNIEYFDNVMTSDITDDLSVLSSSLTTTTGTLWTLRGRDRAVSLLAGGRYSFGTGTVRPYVGGGAGVINVRRTIVDPRVGDVTVAVLTDFGIGEFDLTTKADTGPLVEGAVGVAFYSGPTYVDVGYRYKRGMGLDEALNFSQVVVGVGYKF